MCAAKLIIQAQSYLYLPACAVSIVSVDSIRNCCAPRFLAVANRLGGSGGIYTDNFNCSWKNFNPKKVNRFLSLVLSAQTVAFTNCIQLPTLSDDSSVELFCKTMISYPTTAFVREVSLRKCMLITSEVTPLLAQMHQLEYLDLSFTRASSLSAFGRLPWLKEIVAESCVSLQDEGIVGLEKCPRLQLLNLSYTGVRDYSIFNNSKSLRKLVVKACSRMHTNFQGIACLIEVDVSHMGCNERWWNWDSDRDEDSDEQETGRAQAKPFTGLGNLRSVISNQANIVGFRHLIHTKETLISLEARGCNNLESLTAVSELIYLNRLVLSDCVRIKDNVLKGIQGAVSLEFLELSGCCWITDIRVLSNLSGLRELDLSRTKITVEGTQSLETLIYLEKLDLHCCYDLLSISHFVGKLPNLKHLDIHKIGSSGLRDVGTMLDELEKQTMSFFGNLRFLDFKDSGVTWGRLDERAKISPKFKKIIELVDSGFLEMSISRIRMSRQQEDDDAKLGTNAKIPDNQQQELDWMDCLS